jgi:chemotaxis protein CheX
MSELSVRFEDFEAISTDICATYVSEDAVVLPADQGGSAGADHRAHVVIFGDVCAQVAVECDAESAADLARRMFDLAPDEPVSPDDVADALGEIANVVGGNVKSLSPLPANLGLPQVQTPAPAQPEESLCRVDVVWDGGRVTLSVHTSESAGRVPARQGEKT